MAGLKQWKSSNKNKRIYYFQEGGRDDSHVLGIKGANFCHLTRMKIPIPPGCIINEDTSLEYFHANQSKIHGQHDGRLHPDLILPPNLDNDINEAIKKIESRGKSKFASYGHGNDVLPLLFSVRSSPLHHEATGVLEAIVNIGMNRWVIEDIRRHRGLERFAMDLAYHFYFSFGMHVLKIERNKFDAIVSTELKREGLFDTRFLTLESLTTIVEEFKKLGEFPEDPYQQVKLAVKAVYNEWFSTKEIKSRHISGICVDRGIAVIIQDMVYGNLRRGSGTGVVYSRHPISGEKELYGEFLYNSEGNDIYFAQETIPIRALKGVDEDIHAQLDEYVNKLEQSYKDMLCIEFAMEQKRLYILDVVPANRTPLAAVRCACDMVEETLLTVREAVLKVDAESLTAYHHEIISENQESDLKDRIIALGSSVTLGVATGHAVFNSKDAIEFARQGKPVILILKYFTLDDVEGFKAASGIITMRGGVTSYLGGQSRSLHKCAITNAALGGLSLVVEYSDGATTTTVFASYHDKTAIKKGQIITIDASNGRIIDGTVAKVKFESDSHLKQFMTWVDEHRRMKVFVNIRNEKDIQKCIESQADGAGTIFLEEFFQTPERVELLRALLILNTRANKENVRDKLESALALDFEKIFLALRGKHISVRLFQKATCELFDMTDEDITTFAQKYNVDLSTCRDKIESLRHGHPDMGVMGCRLAILQPRILEVQIRGILTAAIKDMGNQHIPADNTVAIPPFYFLIPMVSTDHEIEAITDFIHRTAQDLFTQLGESTKYAIGCNMALPRACLRANAIAAEGDIALVQYDTDSLTQFIYGLTKDEAKKILHSYTMHTIFRNDPFVTLDKKGVGYLLNIATTMIKKMNQYIKIGIGSSFSGSLHCCDVKTVFFFEELGLHYLNCDADDVEVVKLAASQAALQHSHKEFFHLI